VKNDYGCGGEAAKQNRRNAAAVCSLMVASGMCRRCRGDCIGHLDLALDDNKAANDVQKRGEQ